MPQEHTNETTGAVSSEVRRPVSHPFRIMVATLLVIGAVAGALLPGQTQPLALAAPTIDNYLSPRPAPTSVPPLPNDPADLIDPFLTTRGAAQVSSRGATRPPAGNEIVRDGDLLQPPAVQTVERTTTLIHVVAEGETALEIADKYGISMETIWWANALDDPDALQIDQELIIPPISGVYHIVEEGDALRALAERYDVDPSFVARYNELEDADHLTIGQQLMFPGGRMPPPVQAIAQVSARGIERPASSGGRVQIASSSGSRSGAAIANYALQFLGRPYVFGATGPYAFDCSGFVQHVLRNFGIPIARDTWGQIQYGQRISMSELEPGDIVFFENTYTWGISHVGIYIGGGQFVNAQDERSGVAIASLYSSYWSVRYYGARRVH